MEEREIIASNITFLRKRAGLSQLELAEKIQYSNKNISKWEKAETTPSVFTLKRLAEIFGITVDMLVSEPLCEDDFKEDFNDNQAIDSVGTDTDFNEASHTEKADERNDIKLILGLPMSIKVLYLLMAEAIILVGGFIAVIVLGLLDVTSFNKWLILLYILPAMCLAVFIFIACVKKRANVLSLSLFGWLLTLCFYVSFIEVTNIYLIFFLMAAIQLLIICVMLLINLNIIRHIKNKLLKKSLKAESAPPSNNEHTTSLENENMQKTDL